MLALAAPARAQSPEDLPRVGTSPAETLEDWIGLLSDDDRDDRRLAARELARAARAAARVVDGGREGTPRWMEQAIVLDTLERGAVSRCGEQMQADPGLVPACARMMADVQASAAVPWLEASLATAEPGGRPARLLEAALAACRGGTP